MLGSGEMEEKWKTRLSTDACRMKRLASEIHKFRDNKIYELRNGMIYDTNDFSKKNSDFYR